MHFARLFSIIGATALSLLATGAGAAQASYTILMSGAKKGSLEVSDPSPGTRQVRWSYNDRGRGPDLTMIRQVDANGIPVRIAVDGKDYRKATIAERFDIAGGTATWRSDADQGSGPARGFYLPNQSSEEDIAALARALLAAPDGELDLLPLGRARIEKALDQRFTAGGQSVDASLYLITGLNLGAAGVWLDTERQLFAAGGSWIGVIRQGFEGAQQELLDAQGTVFAERGRARIANLGRRPTGALVIRNAALFDPVKRVLRRGTTVVVLNDRIARVGPDAKIKVPAGAEMIDARGQVLLPGMWDMHAHLLDSGEGLFQLMAGVTSVRDLGNDAARLDRISGMYARSEAPGPRVFKALLIDGKGPLAVPIGTLVETPEELRTAIAKAAADGYTQIKLYSSLPLTMVPIAVAEARKHGLRVSGHTPAGMSMSAAITAGFDEIQHAYFWLLNFMSPEIQAKTNSPSRFTDAGLHGHEVNADSPEARALIALAARRHVVLDPTFVAFEGMFVGEKGKDNPGMAPWVDRMPANALRGGRTGGRGTTPTLRAAYTGSFERAKQMLKRFHDAGVAIVPGTDGSGLFYSRELEVYTEAGIAPKDVLYMATLGSARVAGDERHSGSIAPGKRADLVLIDGDPTVRMADIRRTRLVVKGGTVYDPDALAAAAGLLPAKGRQ